MKKPSGVPDRGEDVEDLKRRVARLERTTATLSARILELFGPAPKPVALVPVAGAVGAARPAAAAAR